MTAPAPFEQPRRRRAALLTALLTAALVAEVVVVAFFTARGTLGRPEIRHASLWMYLLTLPLFALAVALLAVLRLRPRTVLFVVLGASAALQIAALTHAPTTSDDDYRYVWDAKVQLGGTDPYRYAPQDPQVAPYRDAFTFPTDLAGRCPHPLPDGGCTEINRPSVHTIYPPVAEGAFVLIRLASAGGHGKHLPVQLAGATGVLAIAVLLARQARSTGRAPWTVAVWAWCPLPILEYSNAGHIDWLAVLFVVGAVLAAARHRAALTGLLIGAAIVTKLYPAVVLPALMRRRPGVTLAVAAGAVVLSYVPHVLAVGSKVVGYLPGYLREENYTNGDRLLLIGAVLPHPVDSVAGVLLLAAVVWFVWRRADTMTVEQAAVLLMGTVLLVTTPAYGWYAGVLLALVVLSGSYEWLPVALAPTLVYLIRLDVTHDAAASRAVYASAAVLAGLAYLYRRRPGAMTSPSSQRRRTVPV